MYPIYRALSPQVCPCARYLYPQLRSVGHSHRKMIFQPDDAHRSGCMEARYVGIRDRQPLAVMYDNPVILESGFVGAKLAILALDSQR
jgi:hypothetical protein